MQLNFIKFKLFSITLTIFAWVLTYFFNQYFLEFFSTSTFCSYIFIPSGIRVAAILLLGFDGSVGIFLGSLITGIIFLTNVDIKNILFLSSLSAFIPYFVTAVIKFQFKILDDLSNLKLLHIIISSIIYGFINSLTHNFYIHYYINEGNSMWRNCLSMFIGDVIGIIFVLLAVAYFFKLKD